MSTCALKGLKQLKQSCNQLDNDPRQVPTSADKIFFQTSLKKPSQRFSK